MECSSARGLHCLRARQVKIRNRKGICSATQAPASLIHRVDAAALLRMDEHSPPASRRAPSPHRNRAARASRMPSVEFARNHSASSRCEAGWRNRSAGARKQLHALPLPRGQKRPTAQDAACDREKTCEEMAFSMDENRESATLLSSHPTRMVPPAQSPGPATPAQAWSAAVSSPFTVTLMCRHLACSFTERETPG